MFCATPSKKSKKDGDHLIDEAADQDVESGSTPSVKIDDRRNDNPESEV